MDSDVIAEMVARVRKKLNIEHIEVHVQVHDADYILALGVPVYGCVDFSEEPILMYIAAQHSPVHVETIIAHEFRHVWQVRVLGFEPLAEEMVWPGTAYAEALTFTERSSGAPYEADAYWWSIEHAIDTYQDLPSFFSLTAGEKFEAFRKRAIYGSLFDVVGTAAKYYR